MEIKFKPMYYEFFDDNILYDGRYAMYTGSNAPEKSDAGITLRENQNSVHKRIKEETQYIESLHIFEEVENNIAQLSGDTYEADETPTQNSPRIDIFKANQGIGDAYLQGGSQHMPAWKFVTLQGQISSSTSINTINKLSRIPQVNVELNYKKQVAGKQDITMINPDPRVVGDLTTLTRPFKDGHRVEFKTDNALFYLEEANTIMLTKNYDIEVFDITITDSISAATIFDILQAGTPIYDSTVTINDGTTSITFTFKNGASASTDIEAGDILATSVTAQTDLAIRLVTVINNYVADSGTSLKVIATNNLAQVTITNLNGTGFRTNTEVCGALVTTSDIAVIDPSTGGIFTGGTDATESLEKKYFEDNIQQIVDGMMVTSTPQQIVSNMSHLGTGSVRYYFDILTDQSIRPEIACKASDIFNNESYYV